MQSLANALAAIDIMKEHYIDGAEYLQMKSYI